jgi:hypothetical protein
MNIHILLEVSAIFDELLERKQFEVFRYSLKKGKQKVKPSSKTKMANYDTNLLRISYATAITICSLHADRREYYFDIIASVLSHLNFVEPAAAGNAFLLKKSRLDRLRDFSQTGRTGELAQGINYLFTQEILGFPFIIDHHLFCDRLNINVSGQTSDFVLLNPYQNKLGLLESKGEAAKKNTVTTKLNDSLEQLDATQHNLLLNSGLYAQFLHPVCSRFGFATPKVSSINYCDLNTAPATAINRQDIIRRHFASWFYLIGDFTRAELLINDEMIPSLNEGGDVVYDGGDSEIFWVSDIRWLRQNNDLSLRLYWRYFKNFNFRLGIRKDFVALLTASVLPEEIPVQPAVLEGTRQWFRDGTVVEMKSEEE